MKKVSVLLFLESPVFFFYLYNRSGKDRVCKTDHVKVKDLNLGSILLQLPEEGVKK